MFEYFGLIAVVLSWVIGGFVVLKWRQGNDKSISEHLASTRVGYLLGMAVLCAVGSLFYVWILTYLVPKLQLGPAFVVLLTLLVVLQIITGIIPDDGLTWRSKVHRAVAYTEAFLFIPLSILMLISPQVSVAGQISGIVTLGYFAFSAFLFCFVPKAKKNYIFFQALYIVVFQLQIIVTAYL